MPTYVISLCPPTNSLYFNVRGRGRVKSRKYGSWIAGELKALLAQHAKPVAPPVALKLVFPQSMRGDLDGRLKASIDILVKAGIIPDDNKSIVRSITADFGHIEGVKVSIEPYIQPEKVAA